MLGPQKSRGGIAVGMSSEEGRVGESRGREGAQTSPCELSSEPDLGGQQGLKQAEDEREILA